MRSRILFLLVTVFIAMTVLVSCQDDQSSKQTDKIVTATLKRPIRNLFYSGDLMPLTMTSVLSPAEGRIQKIDFNYGQYIEKGAGLVMIDSLTLTQNFQKSVTDYLQKKSALANALEESQASKALYKAGVISREAFLTSQTQYRTSELNFYQSRFAMEKILLQAGVDPQDIEKLTLGDIEEIQKLLQRQFKHIVVSANAKGIALFPVSSDSSDEKVTRLTLGSAVKQGQLLLMIGDLRGLSARIQVDETVVNHIKKGMPVTVTGSAFPNMILKGNIAAVSSQAKNDQSNQGPSEFPVLIKIPNLTKAQRKIIKVGMSAKIQIAIQQPSMLMLPLNAVSQKKGQAVVTLVTKAGKHKTVLVITGFTTETDVAIVSGVKAGDRVLVRSKAAAP